MKNDYKYKVKPDHATSAFVGLFGGLAMAFGVFALTVAAPYMAVTLGLLSLGAGAATYLGLKMLTSDKNHSPIATVLAGAAVVLGGIALGSHVNDMKPATQEPTKAALVERTARWDFNRVSESVSQRLYRDISSIQGNTSYARAPSPQLSS